MTDLPERYQDLFTTLIEDLELSNRAMTVLRWNGITFIGDCLVFYYQDIQRIYAFPYRLTMFMYSEVELKLKARGYWSFLEDGRTWHDLKGRRTGRRMIVIHQREYKDLGKIPIEHFNLSPPVFDLVWRLGPRSVGDMVDMYLGFGSEEHIERHQAYLQRRHQVVNAAVRHPPVHDTHVENQVMFDEVEEKFKEYGYWEFVIDLC